MKWLPVLLLIGVFLVPASASADVIRRRTLDCPDGSVQKQSHGSVWCAPLTCTDESTCKPGQSCRPQGICVVSEEKWMGGRGGKMRTVQRAASECESQDDCAEGTCKVLDRCVSKAKGASTPPTRETPTPPIREAPTPLETEATGAEPETEPEPETETATAAEPAEPETTGDAVETEPEADGCNCSASTGRPAGVALVLVLLGAVARRRLS